MAKIQDIVTKKDIQEAGGEIPPSLVKPPKEKPVEKPVEKPIAKPKQKIARRFELPWAPMGEGNTVIKHNSSGRDKKDKAEVIFNIKLVNKIYTIPEGLNPIDERILVEALVQNGFVDITTTKGTMYDKEKQKYIYSAIHPDHGEKNPINGNTTLAMMDEKERPICDKDGKQITIQLQIINGVVKTDDQAVYQALMRAGYYSGHWDVAREDK